MFSMAGIWCSAIALEQFAYGKCISTVTRRRRVNTRLHAATMSSYLKVNRGHRKPTANSKFSTANRTRLWQISHSTKHASPGFFSSHQASTRIAPPPHCPCNRIESSKAAPALYRFADALLAGKEDLGLSRTPWSWRDQTVAESKPTKPTSKPTSLESSYASETN